MCIPIALPLQEWLHERASMLRCTYIACLVFQLSSANAHYGVSIEHDPLKVAKRLLYRI